MLKISYLFIFFMLLAQANAISWESVNNTELGAYNVFSYGATGEGVTDDLDAFNYAIDNATAGSTLVISPGEYFLDGLWEIDKSIEIVMDDATLNFSTNAVNQGVRISSSGVSIEGGSIIGPQYTVSSNTQHGIYAYGASGTDYLSDIQIKNVNVSGWGFYGIKLSYVKNFNIEGCSVGHCYQACIQTLSAENGTISKNDVGPVYTARGGGKYGVALSRNEGTDLAADPRSKNIRVTNNFVHDIVDWEGLDTHGGQNITFSDNTILHCYIGISSIQCDGDSNVEMYAPIGIIISNNVIDWGASDGLSGPGISVGGAEDAQRAVCIISGNYIAHHGSDVSGTTRGAIYAHTSHGLIISQNTFVESARECIFLNKNNTGFSIHGNAFIDPWTDDGSLAYGVYSSYTNNAGHIEGNSFIETGDITTTKTHVADRAIYISNYDATYITIGENYYSGFEYTVYDPGLRTGRGSYVPVSTYGTGTDTLTSIVIPLNTTGGGSRIHVVAWGKMTGTNGDKSVNLVLGSTSIAAIPAASTADDWRIEADFFMSSYAAQKCSTIGYRGTELVGNVVGSAAESMILSDVNLKCTGVCANAADVITQTGMIVEIF